MPKGYEKMKAKFIKDGMSEKDAATKAAKIWNAKHPNKPVGTGKHEEQEPDSKIMLDADAMKAIRAEDDE